MILGQEEKPSLDEDLLVHFGIKGMKWGIHKSHPSSTEDRKKALAKVNQKIDRIDGQKAFEGLALRGYYQDKMYKKAVKKDPNFAYSKLSAEGKKDWHRTASNKAYRSIVMRGAAETAVILGGGIVGIEHLKVNPTTKRGAQAAVVLLAAQHIVIPRAHQISAIRTGNKLEKLQDQKKVLEKRR